MRAGSPKHSPTRRPSSPGKRTQTAGGVRSHRFTDTMLEQKSNDELQIALKEKDVELQHTLNTLIALNEKLEVFNDLKQDKKEHLCIIQDNED